VAVLLTSCGWNNSTSDRDESIDTSALYEPQVLTLIKGRPYQTKEGIYTPVEDAMYYSRYRYLRAIVIGEGK